MSKCASLFWKQTGALTVDWKLTFLSFILIYITVWSSSSTYFQNLEQSIHNLVILKYFILKSVNKKFV
jgi:hypothetical protein